MIQTLHPRHGVLKDKKSSISRNIKVEEPECTGISEGQLSHSSARDINSVGQVAFNSND